jgi:hypothetical protein
LKDGKNKRYLGLVRTDRKGQIYWSFREISKKINQSDNQTKEYANNTKASKK